MVVFSTNDLNTDDLDRLILIPLRGTTVAAAWSGLNS
jgi:hypothetical protein